VSQPVAGPDLASRGELRPFTLCDGIMGLFTGRHGGVSTGPFSTLNLGLAVGDDPAAVARNRSAVLRAVAPGPVRVAWLHQEHGAAVVYAPAVPGPAGSAAAGSAAAGSAVSAWPAGPSDGQSPLADASFTDTPSVALGVQVADCAPVLIGEPAAGLVGAAHAGRPGLLAGVIPALVAAMRAAGGDPGQMRAAIGPAICGPCYEVPAQMRDQVAAVVPGSACATRKGTPAIDVRAGVRAQLTSLGVGGIWTDDRCTAESAELFSYRRDGQTGRFAGLIWLAP
jgi:YfiH family protein